VTSSIDVVHKLEGPEALCLSVTGEAASNLRYKGTPVDTAGIEEPIDGLTAIGSAIKPVEVPRGIQEKDVHASTIGETNKAFAL
jgi:hypothetical protein